MKKILSASLAILMVSLLFTSCQKANLEPQKNSSFMSSAENRIAVAKALNNYFTQHYPSSPLFSGDAAPLSSQGAEFVVPFFSNESTGVLSFDPSTSTLAFASFDAELGTGDYYRKNPDGTYSVHVNSNTAMAAYDKIDLNTWSSLEYLYGMPAHLSADYTGELVEFSFTDENGNVIVFRFIDTFDSGRAISITGGGNVGQDGMAPWKRLAIKVAITPGGQNLVDLSIK
jgi:hypothetical protein